ncbi:MAG: hypothetical protein COA42_10785 [Alteromonadaceae bacterium]|nr:MAG: hypothetical protein COA42_10785 [Alteromonadaceae bacterium]
MNRIFRKYGLFERLFVWLIFRVGQSVSGILLFSSVVSGKRLPLLAACLISANCVCQISPLKTTA